MNPTSSFLGKCTTVLIGAALSWVTTTNQDAARLASRLFGGNQASALREDLSAVSSLANSPVRHPAPMSSTTTLAPQAGPSETRQMQEISRMLKDLGATYLRVEKLANTNETWFRVRCDLVRGPNDVKCCLESTRNSAVAAMQDVLRAAEPSS